MKKPIIYYQFDYEKFIKKHYQKGYFDYKKDGFGPICYTEKEVVKNIINYPRKYMSRPDKFFVYNDRKNCERIYNEIMQLNMKEVDSYEK